ncbi:CAP domain-containing protein [Ilyomonas limi]|uniref:CAP domain-containing protein n=1 Tax=Ilyomonas limi TaxID=2575867 RepID=A0A4U3L0U3_9BACT|nr:CAP domain-containing protein [Ilyomonas limi]TKK67784.1 CAP domain-containing protein [Ilyomonas limi]
MRNIVTILLAFLFLTNFSACAQAKDLHTRVTNYNKINLATLNTDILTLINQHRKEMGLNELQMLNVANTEAQHHSVDMVKGTTPFGHDGFESRIADIRKVTGFISGAAENVAYGNLTAAEVVDGWLHSPGHKKNIEGNYNLTGIGTVQRADGVIFFTQIFIKK